MKRSLVILIIQLTLIFFLGFFLIGLGLWFLYITPEHKSVLDGVLYIISGLISIGLAISIIYTRKKKDRE